MTATEFRATLAACGWSARQVATFTGRAQSAGTDWAAGRKRVPDDVGAWLTRRAKAMAADPPPRRQAA
jgi:hypothetical protein